MTMIGLVSIVTPSSVARGGAGGAIAPPPHWPADQNAE